MRTVIVYVHGLWLGGGESFLLRRRLARELAAECRVFSYRSVSANIDVNAAALGECLLAIRADTLHLVAHSMGGLIVLRLFEQWSRERGAEARAGAGARNAPLLPPGRVVFMGSPVRGSRSAVRFARLPLGRRMLGHAASVLLEQRERRWSGERELGVITGELALGTGRLLGAMDGSNDGTVWADETELPGATDQLRLKVSHSGMVYSSKTAEQAAAFLRNGRFARRSAHATEIDPLMQNALMAASRGDFELAVSLYDRIVALQPASALAHYKRANALKNLGRLDESLASYDRAIEHDSAYAHAYCNRGVVQQSLGKPKEALMSYDRAIALDPSDAMAHYNRALLLAEGSQYEQALCSYDASIAVDPQFADAQYNRALTLLFLGDFERGWHAYEWRWKNAQRLAIGELRDFHQPLWLGDESVAGKRLLLHSEAGLGDTLQFCRYAPLAAALGATVFLEVQPALVRMLGNMNGVAATFAKGSPLPEFEYHCPLMSLPLAFGTTLENVPAGANYLNSDVKRTEERRAVLAATGRLRVGLVWSGNPNNTIDPRRTVRLAEMAAQLPRNLEYFSLQKDVRAEDRAALEEHNFIRPFDETSDFIDTAALCECMDVVVTVDTSVAHLSAALGQRTWILLPFIPDWRWMREREDSPWYPSARLYRQRAPGEWNEVFARIGADLAELANLSSR